MGKFQGYNPETEELIELESDVADPAHQYGGVPTGLTGMAATANATKNAWAHPIIRYKNSGADLILTGDLYKIGDELSLQIYCPRCRHNLQISNRNKAMEYDPKTNLISIEPFRCTWELYDEPNAGLGITGLCGWTVAVDKGIARDI